MEKEGGEREGERRTEVFGLDVLGLRDEIFNLPVDRVELSSSVKVGKRLVSCFSLLQKRPSQKEAKKNGLKGRGDKPFWIHLKKESLLASPELAFLSGWCRSTFRRSVLTKKKHPTVSIAPPSENQKKKGKEC